MASITALAQIHALEAGLSVRWDAPLAFHSLHLRWRAGAIQFRGISSGLQRAGHRFLFGRQIEAKRFED